MPAEYAITPWTYPKKRSIILKIEVKNFMKVGVIGCLGRMGRIILNELAANENVEVAAAVARSGSDISIAEAKVKIIDSIDRAFELSDIVIDFTTKECLLECLRAAVKFKKPLVSGTTGIEGVNLEDYSQEVPILWSANMSIGVNALLKLVKKAAELLGNGYDVEIWEMHHNLKKDAPSGTALELGKTAAEALGIELNVNQYRNDIRKKNSIGFAVSRGGGVVGDHSVMFINSSERIELNHKAIDRTIFAKGAVQAAIWLYNNKKEIPGLYSMQDII